MRTIYQINTFANSCGYFYNAYLEEDFNCNNGYNCKHPEQEESEVNKETGKEVGKCYAWSCPLGCEADQEDFDDPEIDNDGFTEWEDCEFIVVDDKEEKSMPEEINKIQFHGNFDEIEKFVGGDAEFRNGKLLVATLDGPLWALNGDWIVKDADGKFRTVSGEQLRERLDEDGYLD